MAKKGCLGCSFPLIIGVISVFFLMAILTFLAGPIGKNLVGDIGLPSWMSVHQPETSLSAKTVFHIFGFPIANSVIATWLTIVVLVVIAWLGTRKMKLVPKGMQNFVEFALGALYNFCTSTAGERNGRRFFPVVASIFLFVIMNAWLSLLPFFGPALVIETAEGHVDLFKGANTDISIPLILALFSFLSVWYFGFKDLGFKKYLGKFFAFGKLFGSIKLLFTGKLKEGLGGLFYGAIDIFVGALELLSEFVRIISFTFRLFGNMTAGEILLVIITFLVPWIAVLPFYGLELLVGFIQALIFAGLTLVFLTMAVAHHGEEHK